MKHFNRQKVLILDFKSLETVLKMPDSKILNLEDSERLTNLSTSSKRNSEFRREDDRLSNMSRDLFSEDPFYDTTMRTRRTKFQEGLGNPQMEGLRGKLMIKPQKSVEFINRQFDLVNKKNQKTLRDSNSVTQIFKKATMSSKINSNKRRFFELATKFKGVCLARCSPSMKSLVTEVLCKQMNKIVLSIGDGGNDVGMIQISNVGVGILGKEGNQAALAADFNISQFR